MNTIWIVLPILTLLMFDLGLVLRVEDFGKVFRRPLPIVIALFGQLVLLPLIALGLAKLFRLPPVFFIGLVLIACCPGGSSSNVFSKLAGGDVALGIALHYLWPVAAEKTDKFLSKLAFPLLLVLITVFYIQHHRTILENIGILGLCVTALILVAIGCSSLLPAW